MAPCAPAHLDWTTPLAVALITRGPLPGAALKGIAEAFEGVDELRLVLANGEAHTVESYPLLSKGQVNERPQSLVAVVPTDATACDRAMDSGQTLLITSDMEERTRLLDWERLNSSSPGLRWMLACPLSCGCRVMGAVLVAGSTSELAVDTDWLKAWTCEMAHTIAHVSVQVMEASLEILQRIFPGEVLRTLVLQACSVGGEISPDMAQRLAQLVEQEGGAPTAAQLVAMTPQLATHLGGGGAEYAPAVVLGADPHSPFALKATVPLPPSSTERTSAESVRSQPESFELHLHPVKVHSPSLSPRTAAQGQGASRATSNASAVALLRQASQASVRTDLSYLIAEDPNSPCSEVAGYEDLLAEAAAEHAQRRASWSLEKARSRPLASPLASTAGEPGVPPLFELEPAGPAEGLKGQAVNRTAAGVAMRAPQLLPPYPPSTLDLAFRDPRLERAFQRSLHPDLHRCDRLTGWAHVALLAALLLGCVEGRGVLSSCGGMVLAGAVLLVAPAVASLLAPAWWQRYRQHCIAGVRIVSMAVYAWFVMLRPASGEATAIQRVAVETGVAALLVAPLRFPLLLGVHLPVQLAGLWIATAAHAHLHRRHLTLLQLPGSLAVQLCFGLLLPSAIVYLAERRQRRAFLAERLAARRSLSAGSSEGVPETPKKEV